MHFPISHSGMMKMSQYRGFLPRCFGERMHPSHVELSKALFLHPVCPSSTCCRQHLLRDFVPQPGVTERTCASEHCFIENGSWLC